MYTMNTQKRGRPSVVQSTSSLSGGGGSGAGSSGASGTGASSSAGGSNASGAGGSASGGNDDSNRPKDARDPRETAHPRDPRRQPPASAAASDNLTDELAALFECPVCFEFVLPPIMQCQVGHLVCASCRPKLSCCPTCRGTLGDFRNISMEKVANNLLFPCKHKQTGCRMSLALNNKAEHEEVCEFRPYSCPCPGTSCCWTGQLEEVMEHLDRAHKNILTLKGEDIVFLATEINLPGAVDWVMMQSCFGHHFMLILAKQEKCVGHTQFFAIVQLIGSRKQAEHFAYRLELNGNRRRLTWEAMPRSSHEGVASAIMGSDCLVFDTSIAQLFTDHNNLSINVTISVVSAQRGRQARINKVIDATPREIAHPLDPRRTVTATQIADVQLIDKYTIYQFDDIADSDSDD